MRTRCRSRSLSVSWRAAAGNVLGWLAQQLLLARIADDPAVRATLVDAVSRWAAALGGDRMRRTADALR